jgi:hypothetical protein
MQAKLSREKGVAHHGQALIGAGVSALPRMLLPRLADVVIREFAIRYQAAQSIALPGWTFMRPLKYFL